MRKVYVLWLCLCFVPFVAHAQLEHQKLVGKGTLYYFLWHVYDAKLYSHDGAFSFNQSFTLTLEYKRKLYGDQIADRSTAEIRGLGFKDEVTLAAWDAQMKEIFPDVNDGMSLSGVYQPNQPTVFYKNDQKIGTINDPEFGKWFFGIWLSEHTSEPTLRQDLLGGK